MALNVGVVLETLFCDKESDGWGGSEPFLWQFIVAVTSNPGGLMFFHDGPARLEIAQGMRGGDQRQIPTASGEVRFQLPGDTQLTDLILVAALLEHDSTPDSAIRKGFTAFNATLESKLNTSTLLELKGAKDNGDQSRVDQIVKEIRNAVTSAVTDAIAADEGISGLFINNDDPIDSAFLTFSANQFTHLIPSERFTLRFARKVKLADWQHGQPVEVTTDLFQIDGRIDVNPTGGTVVDLCQADVDRLKAAEDALKGAQTQITVLQQQLQHATPQQKPAIIQQIQAIGAQIDGLIAARDAAAAALQACRDRFRNHVPLGPTGPGVVLG